MQEAILQLGQNMYSIATPEVSDQDLQSIAQGPTNNLRCSNGATNADNKVVVFDMAAGDSDDGQPQPQPNHEDASVHGYQLHGSMSFYFRDSIRSKKALRTLNERSEKYVRKVRYVGVKQRRYF